MKTKSYKAYIASNKDTVAFDSVISSTPKKAIGIIKRRNKGWRDCCIWVVYLHNNGEEQKIYSNEYF